MGTDNDSLGTAFNSLLDSQCVHKPTHCCKQMINLVLALKLNLSKHYVITSWIPITGLQGNSFTSIRLMIPPHFNTVHSQILSHESSSAKGFCVLKGFFFSYHCHQLLAHWGMLGYCKLTTIAHNCCKWKVPWVNFGCDLALHRYNGLINWPILIVYLR